MSSDVSPLNKEVLSKLMRYCAYKERSKKEVVDKLFSLGVNPGFNQPYLQNLIENNFLNYSRFASAFVLGKFRINRWGKQKIKQALYKKELDRDLIEEALSQISVEDYFKTLTDLASNKINSVKAKNKFDLRVKVTRYLSSKGYESELIKECMDQLIKD